ncbi:uncharacterized protein LOC121399005 [Xenopus laevis]|uniref:Uncharacterized protein LOC121399005 n=1 Tax=Xenopus laevis TaxID=8355 RepID=A0A8J1LYV9_XENLA|nr:uncharacterized protein LOC121399005 [Xenopus laevis]XP_041434684.1 uncharacterized protein LOC121399005 [Xenopus laevis]
MSPITRANKSKGQICSALANAFENLNTKSFGALIHKLFYQPPPKDCNRIPRNELENADANKLADLFIRYNTTKKAGQFAVELLADINEKQLSKELEEALIEVENLTYKEDMMTQTSPSLHNSSTVQDENPATDWESTDPVKVWKKSEKTPGKQGNTKYSHLVTITQSHKRHKSERQDKESGHFPKKKQTTNISFESLLCNENPLYEETVTQIKISSCGSNLENPVEGTSHPQISTVHINPKEGTAIHHFQETKPSTVCSNGSTEEMLDNPAEPTSQSLVSVKHKTLQQANTELSQNCLTFAPAPTNVAITSPSPSRSVPVRQDNNTGALTERTNQPDVNHTAPRGRTLPDIKLQALKKLDLQIMEEHHNGKPHVYAKLLFQHFVQFETYKTWTQNTNFDGYRGKNAIPKNLRVAIRKQVRKRFQLTKKDCVEIKRTINGLLAKPRTSGWPFHI